MGSIAEEPLTTKGGYPLDEVVSALQKSVRRGLEVDAAYWARELVRSGMWRYCWRRLLIIAAEDVGLADRDVFGVVEALRSAYTWSVDTSRRHPGWNQMVAMAVLVLARAGKSREVDDYCWHVDRLAGVEVPDYALDGHTARGRAMGRGDEFFAAESGLLVGEVYPSRYRSV